MNKTSLIKSINNITHVKRPDTFCARACYVDRQYSSAFVVAHPTVCVCIYTYIYIHTHIIYIMCIYIYTHTHTHTHTHTS